MTARSGNMTMEQVVMDAKAMRPRSIAKFFAGQGVTIKEIFGTCVALGCTVDGRNPQDLQADIDAQVSGLLRNKFCFLFRYRV